MKIELTPEDEAEMRVFFEKKAREYLEHLLKDWPASDFIKDEVKDKWKPIAVEVIEEVIRDLPTLRKMVKDELISKIRRDAAAALKRADALEEKQK